MTLVEFLAPLLKRTHQARVLAVLYFKERYDSAAALTTDQIRTALISARVPRSAKLNVADVIGKAGHFVDTPGVQGKLRLWSLTESGRQEIRSLLNLPAQDVEVEHGIGTLEGLLNDISDPEIRNYLEESVKCLQVGALRACVVFAWSGAIRTIQNRILNGGIPRLNTAIQKHDQKARHVGRIEDFAYIKDSIVLLAAKDIGILDKNEKDTLEEALNLRNRSGHPGKYRPGVKKVSSFIEDIVSIVFS
ncbi:MAG: hypothetical protein JWN94_189 [Betaproteobacteria bacterium]|nr:hypothetical protein [Betaproteobacteria bacterium]